jgi:phenylpyruvate tautomerase PptA (4-oxalocrotonate tautomerase family)
MPTYTVTHSNIQLSPSQMEQIANAITETHHACTGANTYFAQVIFHESPAGNHFMGGKPVKDAQLFLHGQIRAGRSAELKETLILKLRDALIRDSGLLKDQIWIYITDTLPTQMMEYGEVLPESGKEAEWFAKLSAGLQNKLKALGK